MTRATIATQTRYIAARRFSPPARRIARILITAIVSPCREREGHPFTSQEGRHSQGKVGKSLGREGGGGMIIETIS